MSYSCYPQKILSWYCLRDDINVCLNREYMRNYGNYGCYGKDILKNYSTKYLMGKWILFDVKYFDYII